MALYKLEDIIYENKSVADLVTSNLPFEFYAGALNEDVIIILLDKDLFFSDFTKNLQDSIGSFANKVDSLRGKTFMIFPYGVTMCRLTECDTKD